MKKYVNPQINTQFLSSEDILTVSSNDVDIDVSELFAASNE